MFDVYVAVKPYPVCIQNSENKLSLEYSVIFTLAKNAYLIKISADQTTGVCRGQKCDSIKIPDFFH